MNVRGVVLAVLATLLTLAASEFGLRAIGSGPWTPFPSFRSMPRIADPHPEIGWVNRPGRYSYPLEARSVRLQIDATRCRGPRPPSMSSTLVTVYGGSFAFGLGLSDEDVMARILAGRRPDLDVENCAVPGYGTLQALLWHEERGVRPDVAVYGLVDLHDGRNAGAWSWLHALERSGPEQPWVAAPAARWDGSQLNYTPPTRYQHWPASEQLALIDLAERARISLHDRILRTKSETTIQLVLRFRELAAKQGARFVVALLHAPSRHRYYLRRLAEEEVEVIDLRHPHFPDWSVPGDGHPDERVHRDWGLRLAEVL